MKKSNNDGLVSLTMGEILRNRAINNPTDMCAIAVEYDKRCNFKELNNRVNRLANSLLDMGVHKGDKIGIFMNDRLECLEILFAANKIGAVWIPFNYMFIAEEVKRQLEHSGPKLLFFDEDAAGVIENLEKIGSDVEKYIAVGGKKSTAYTPYESLMKNSSEEEPKPQEEISSEDLAGIVYTSGTTGLPKGAMHTHRTLLGFAFNMLYDVGMVKEDRCLTPYPMFHMGGIIIGFLNVFGGVANYIFGKFDALKFINVLEEEKITLFFAAPTIVNALNSLPEDVKDKHKLSSTTRIWISSAPLYEETRDAFTKRWPHIGILSSYTATEMVFSCLRPKDQAVKPRCVGPAVFGSEIKLMDKDGQEVPHGELGAVYGRGISIFAGYYNNPEANEKSFRGEWVTCEDIGYLDDENYLYLVDRAKDMIISGGENISSMEVENILLQHPAIFECAVIGVYDEYWGEKVHAAVVLHPGQKVGPEEIIDWCRGKMEGFKRPKSVNFIPELPKSPAGKTLKRELREQYNLK